MHILITSAGRRVSLVRAFQTELKLLVPNGKVFAADANPTASAACNVADASFKLPMINDDNYLECLLQVCLKNKISLIIPTIDNELSLLALNRIKFEEYNIQIVVSSIEFINKCRDKRNTQTFFLSKNIRVAKEYTKDNYEFPLFIKPYNGSNSVDTYIIRSKQELNFTHFENEKLMFLEYLDHETFDEFTCDLYYGRDNLLKCVVPRKRVFVRAGEVNKAVTVSDKLVPYLIERLKKIEGARGCLTVQIFKCMTNNEKIYGIEINPRFGGGFPLTYLAGANYPKWIIEEYVFGKKIVENFECWEENLMMLRYCDEILVRGHQS
ncbi:ATP-grasp domain-containing protein [uncultured Eudoraea sp.]|uniref:ATP-grasp domain-containing protein n=1 Tax=uncultured Eudoraea sp. TaxID=1035614 RepID=UPI002608E72D|nr:ATP-grasp domain-containing protein [uncultured Eudoraea sp.]